VSRSLKSALFALIKIYELKAPDLLRNKKISPGINPEGLIYKTLLKITRITMTSMKTYNE
jgi:hypothetical protein